MAFRLVSLETIVKQIALAPHNHLRYFRFVVMKQTKYEKRFGGITLYFRHEKFPIYLHVHHHQRGGQKYFVNLAYLHTKIKNLRINKTLLNWFIENNRYFPHYHHYGQRQYQHRYR